MWMKVNRVADIYERKKYIGYDGVKSKKKVLTTRNPKSSFSIALLNIKALLPLWLAGSKTGPNGYKRGSSQIYMSKRASCGRRRTAQYGSIKINLRLEEIFRTV